MSAWMRAGRIRHDEGKGNIIGAGNQAEANNVGLLSPSSCPLPPKVERVSIGMTGARAVRCPGKRLDIYPACSPRLFNTLAPFWGEGSVRGHC